MDAFAGRDFAVYGIEEADELLMGMLLHAAANDGAVQDIEGSKERGRAVAFVVVRHGAGLPGLERQCTPPLRDARWVRFDRCGGLR